MEVQPRERGAVEPAAEGGVVRHGSPRLELRALEARVDRRDLVALVEKVEDRLLRGNRFRL